MTTKAIQAVLEDYRDRMTDSLVGPLSRDQRETDTRNLQRVNEALAELRALREAAKTLAYIDTGEVARTANAKNKAHELLARIAKEKP